MSRALLTEGNYVSGDAGSASLLTTIVSVGPVYVYADIDEDHLLKFNELVAAKKLDPMQTARFRCELQLADESNFPHKGYIESFDNRLDPDTGQHPVAGGFSQSPTGGLCPDCLRAFAFP